MGLVISASINVNTKICLRISLKKIDIVVLLMFLSEVGCYMKNKTQIHVLFLQRQAGVLPVITYLPNGGTMTLIVTCE